MDPLAFYMLPILALVVLPVPLAIVRRFLALALCLSLGFCATWQDGSIPEATVLSYPF